MPAFSIFQVSADPLSNPTITATSEFVVDIIDNDGTLSDPDADGSQQFDTSTLPGAINSADTEVFELYQGTAGGQPIEFILIRFSAPPLVVLTVGTLTPGQVITGVAQISGAAPPIDFTDISSFVCFTAETEILTHTGYRSVDNLKVGDKVRTLDGTDRPVRWIGRRRYSKAEMKRNPKLFPVCVEAGALGINKPNKPLTTSRQHRFLIDSKISERVSGFEKALVPAVKLTALERVYVDYSVESVEYVHFMLDDHDVVFANGAPAETLYLGREAKKTLSQQALNEIATIFPDLLRSAGGPEARFEMPIGKDLEKTLRRHMKNNKPLLPGMYSAECLKKSECLSANRQTPVT